VTPVTVDLWDFRELMGTEMLQVVDSQRSVDTNEWYALRLT